MVAYLLASLVEFSSLLHGPLDCFIFIELAFKVVKDSVISVQRNQSGSKQAPFIFVFEIEGPQFPSFI